MLINFYFILFYYKLQLCFRCHVHYTPFTHGKWLFKFLNFVQYIYIYFIFKRSQLSNCEFFLNVDNQLISSLFFYDQNSFIKRVFNLVNILIAFDAIVVQVQRSFIKTGTLKKN
jgi:hypothetical protein